MKQFFLFLMFSTNYLLYAQDTIFNKKLEGVTIKALPKKTTDISLINNKRNLSVVTDGISIESIKKTPDRNVADALKRVSAITIQNDKFVLVRGLADRYNSAWLNNTPLPSTEPDRRAFSFDVIPTSVIDNILVYKSASANLPGDYSGGLVQITTKEVSDNFFNVSFGTSIGTLTTFNKFNTIDPSIFPNTFPSTYKYRISTNGDKRLFTKQFENQTTKSIESIPNLNGGISFGYKKDKWNALFSSSIRDTWTINYVDRKDYQSSSELAYDYKDTIFTKRFSTTGLLNLTYLGENRYTWKTFFNYQKENTYLNRSGNNFDNLQEVKSNSSNHLNTVILNSQLEGKIKTLDFNLGYNFIFREQPDYRVNPITKSLGTNENYQIAWRDTYRFWSIMNENSVNANIHKQFDNIKVGAGYLKRTRDFKARVFRYESIDMLNEITNNTDKYNAEFDLSNAYVMWDNQFGKWKINSGLRLEYNIFNVSTADFNGENIKVTRNYLDLLPSVNLSYNLDKTKYRLSISKSLSRPEFREVANFAYYDFVRNAQILGNSNLEKSDIYNLDLKWEYYPKTGENITISLFGKNFVKPIEQIVADGSVPSNLLLTFTNPKSAILYGIELELKKKVTNWLDVYTNASLMNSQVNVNKVKRQLQGQSNYVLNAGLNLKKDKNTINLAYNRVGDRISAVGFQGYPDIFENSRDIIDISFMRKLKNADFKLSIADLLAQPSINYQKSGNRNLITTRNERTISLSINLNL